MVAVKSVAKSKELGFSLIEIIIVMVIIGVLAMIAFPLYQDYVIKTNRSDMMIELQNRANILESRKIAEGSYSKLKNDDENLLTDLELNYPTTGTPLYTVEVSPTPLTSDWEIKATVIASTIMNGDGSLSLNAKGIKCRDTACGLEREWQDGD